ncbi:MAG: ArsR family transcriptional regulator [Alphaproteobacteria bacterium]|nr:MAG: ArsR family transcriptional regulator [Alphaproteobacteria bacterium]
MSLSFSAFHAAHRRLSILQALEGSTGYECNDSLLSTVLHQLGLQCTRDQVRAELAWLAEVQLVTVREIGGSLMIATATERGLDVAAGRARAPGVAVPAPGSD